MTGAGGVYVTLKIGRWAAVANSRVLNRLAAPETLSTPRTIHPKLLAGVAYHCWTSARTVDPVQV